MLSVADVKLRKLPTSAIPLAPIKFAITLDVINPMAILIITLKLFKDVTLNKGVRIIFLTISTNNDLRPQRFVKFR